MERHLAAFVRGSAVVVDFGHESGHPRRNQRAGCVLETRYGKVLFSVCGDGHQEQRGGIGNLLKRGPGLLGKRLPVGLLGVGHQVAFADRGLEFRNQFGRLGQAPFQIQPLRQCLGLIECVSKTLLVVARRAQQHMGAIPHQHHRGRIADPRRGEDLSRPVHSPAEPFGVFSVCHAVGSVDDYDHADALLVEQPGRPVSKRRTDQGKRHQGQHQASQHQQQVVFQSDLAGTDNHGPPQKFHGRPIGAAPVLLVEQVDNDRHRHPGSRQSSP